MTGDPRTMACSTLPGLRRSALALASTLLLTVQLPAQQPWPAEPAGQATNLTAIEGPGNNDFHEDLSGACWNPLTRTLWLVRNGPGGSDSKLWAAVEDGSGGFEIAYRGGQRGEWTGFGDLEGVTQADWSEDVVYLIIEGEEHIEEYDVSTFGTALLVNDWDTSAWLPTSGNLGAEGITFVPDGYLAHAGFVDATGSPYLSTGGMGGLMFVGHQNGGGLFVFDLDRSTGGIVFVGEYQTDYPETAGLEFDRSTGLLYVWHDADYDILSVLDLTSIEVAGASYRRFDVVESFWGPTHANNEGIAVVSAADCRAGGRSLFMTIDDGGAWSLLWYDELAHGCGGNPVFCPGDGTGIACPCGNDGEAGAGCANSFAPGARLTTFGTNSTSIDNLGFLASGLIPGQGALLFSGTTPVAGGTGVPFGDGLRCAGGAVRRLKVRAASELGEASWGPGYAVGQGWTSGDTRFFQVWYRDPIASPCLQAFNLTNGVEVTFAP